MTPLIIVLSGIVVKAGLKFVCLASNGLALKWYVLALPNCVNYNVTSVATSEYDPL